MSNMYERILGLCEKRGIKPGRVCAETGLSRGMMTDLKMGRTKELSAKNTKVIADYFNVTTDYLLGTEKETAPIPEDEHEIGDEDLKAAFWGGEQDMSKEDWDEMWEDVQDFARFRAEQQRKKKNGVSN